MRPGVASTSALPAGFSLQACAARSAARSAAARTTASSRCSTASRSWSAATSRPVTRLASLSRMDARRVCSSRMKSPVPTTSCQRATTSPRRSEPLRSASSTSCRADAYARSTSRAKIRGGGELLRGSALDRARAAGKAAEGAGQRSADQIRPRLRVGREPVEPAPHGCEVGVRQATALEHGLAHDEKHGVDPPAYASSPRGAPSLPAPRRRGRG